MGMGIPQVVLISGHKDVKQRRLTHNLKVVGSNPTPATKLKPLSSITYGFFCGWFLNCIKR